MVRKKREKYSGQRNKEKYELFKIYRAPAIEQVFKYRFFALFGHSCFKCGYAENPGSAHIRRRVLCIDHHLPMALGGHLVPGNLVALCRSCNGKKLDLPPEEFYSVEELKRLQPLLDREEEILAFEFDWESWHVDRKAYLLRLGVDPALVNELLFNPEHLDYVGVANEKIEVSITVELDEILQNEKR